METDTDTEWIDDVLTGALPLYDKPEVTALWIDNYSDALRILEAFGSVSEDGQPTYMSISRLPRGSAQIHNGVCCRGKLYGAYTGIFLHQPNGIKFVRFYLFMGPHQAWEWMKEEAFKLTLQIKEAVLGQHRSQAINSYN